jgi:hypothetical protein
MAVKRLQISEDDGATWYTFPGNKGDRQIQTNDINDTIFGAAYQSGQPGIANWNMSCNGVFKGFAGYVTKVMRSGTPTTFTGLATTLVSGKTYKITDATKNIWDRLTTVAVTDNAVAVPANEIESIDYLHGRVTLTSGHTVVGPILVSGKYLPMTAVAGANSFTLTQTANSIDQTDYESAQANDGYRSYIYGLKTVKLSLKGFYDDSNLFEALVEARDELVIEINLDGTGLTTARGWFRALSNQQSGNVGELEDATVDFTLSVPSQENISLPFSWLVESSSTLPTALRIALDNWETGEALTDVRYMADGVNGFAGKAVITDMTLTGGLDVMNDFSMKFQGSDVPDPVP